MEILFIIVVGNFKPCLNFLPNLVASNYASIGLTSFSTNAKEVCIFK